MAQEKSPASSASYLSVFAAIYVGLAVIAMVVGTMVPWQSVPGVNSFISLMMLVFPAWVAARHFLRVDGRAPRQLARPPNLQLPRFSLRSSLICSLFH